MGTVIKIVSCPPARNECHFWIPHNKTKSNLHLKLNFIKEKISSSIILIMTIIHTTTITITISITIVLEVRIRMLPLRLRLRFTLI